MKKMNKMIAAMMLMVITTAMPSVAADRRHNSDDRRETVVVVTNHRNPHAHHPYRPDVQECTFRVSRHAARHNAVAMARRINGVMGAYMNPRTREITVRYDARVTSARHIIRIVG